MAPSWHPTNTTMLLHIKQLNPSQVTPTFKGRIKPSPHDLQCGLLGQHSQPERDHIGIIAAVSAALTLRSSRERDLLL
jgi:hypothetical protein